MIQLTFSEEEIKQLDYERYNYPHPHVQRKLEALLLKAKGLPHHQIAHCVGICSNTLHSYLEQYQQGGLEALKQVNFAKPTSELEPHQQRLETYFKEHPPTTIAHAAAMIEELTGLKRRPTQVRVFLKRMGLKRLKTYAVPAKVDVEAQETFKKKR